MSNPKFANLIRKISFYPPYLGMGIRVQSFSDDFTRFEVQLRPRWYTRNLFGTHFGGSLYAMADPFYVFIVTMNFGRGYVVWDKAASIDFLKPAKGVITGVYEISAERLEEMKAEVDTLGKNTYRFEANLLNESGETVARVSKEVYVRAKQASR